MKKKSNVEDTLLEIGFKIDENNENYVCGETVIPATEAIRHTVDSFVEKMNRRGWMPKSGSDTPEIDYPRLFVGLVLTTDYLNYTELMWDDLSLD